MSRTFLSQSPISLILLTSSFGMSGCVGRQTGSEIEIDNGGTAGEYGPHCEEANSTPLAGGETVEGTSLSEEVLAGTIAGEYESELAWNAAGTSGVVITPKSGDSSISIKIEPIFGSAEWVERKVVEAEKNDGEDQPAIGIDPAQLVCDSFLRMDASVTVKSDNGAFDDIFVTSFSTVDGHVALASISLPSDELDGSFAVDVGALENGSASARLELSLGYGSLSGRVEVGIESHNSEVAMAGNIPVGLFPKDNPCEYGTLIGLDSQLADAVDAALQAHTEFDFSWQGEESFELDVVPTLTALCLATGYGEEPGSVSGAMNLSLSSSGNEINGTWPLSVGIDLDASGDVARVNVLRNSYVVDSTPSGQFEAVTGIQGITSDAEELSYSFGYSIDVVEDSPVSGELTILELTLPDCAKAGYEPEVVESPDGGSGSAGCEGIDVVESKFAQFHER